MKNSLAAILLALALAFVAFVAGYYFGHNANDADIYISGYQNATPSTPPATSTPDATSQTPIPTPSATTPPSSTTSPTQPTAAPTVSSTDTTPTEPTVPPQTTPPTEPNTTQPTSTTVPTQPTQAPTSATKPAMTLENMAPININTASQEMLELLPGIGPKKAAAIIQYRQEIGGFRCVEELLEVSGIGEKTFEKLLPYITV